MKLTRTTKQSVGADHRMGWPAILEALTGIGDRDGLLFDDFVEASFTYQRGMTVRSVPYKQPWGGIFHHIGPVGVERFDRDGIPRIVKSEDWKVSAPHLKLAIFLSEFSADQVAPFLPKATRIAVLRHPIQATGVDWVNLHQLVQFGWYLKDINAICRIKPVDDWEYFRLRPQFSATAAETSSHVEDVPRLDNESFDIALASSIGFSHYYGVSASNTILDCMGRGTPILLNRLQASEEYLGKDYPLFYEHLEEAHGIVSNDGRIQEARHYLRSSDLSGFSLQGFLRSVEELVASTGEG